MSERVVTSLPPELAQFARARALEAGTTLDQVVGEAYHQQAARLREGWRPAGRPAPRGGDDPFARPVRARPTGAGMVQVTFRGFGRAALEALDELAAELGCVRSGGLPNRSAVIALLLAAAAEREPG